VRENQKGKHQNNIDKLAKLIRACLDWYLTAFGTEFPYTKLDILFVSSFNDVKAIKNAGCIVLDESFIENELNLLESTELNKIIANDICHMWFGNCVTPSWWNDQWMIDSISLFFSQLCLMNLSKSVNYS